MYFLAKVYWNILSLFVFFIKQVAGKAEFSCYKSKLQSIELPGYLQQCFNYSANNMFT